MPSREDIFYLNADQRDDFLAYFNASKHREVDPHRRITNFLQRFGNRQRLCINIGLDQNRSVGARVSDSQVTDVDAPGGHRGQLTWRLTVDDLRVDQRVHLGEHAGRPIREHVQSLAFPGLGTGIGRVSPELCARQVRAPGWRNWLRPSHCLRRLGLPHSHPSTSGDRSRMRRP